MPEKTSLGVPSPPLMLLTPPVLLAATARIDPSGVNTVTGDGMGLPESPSAAVPSEVGSPIRPAAESGEQANTDGGGGVLPKMAAHASRNTPRLSSPRLLKKVRAWTAGAKNEFVVASMRPRCMR